MVAFNREVQLVRDVVGECQREMSVRVLWVQLESLCVVLDGVAMIPMWVKRVEDWRLT